MAFTRPRASQINFDVTNISDPLVRINSGQSGANDKDVVSYLLSKGANKNIVNRDGLTASQVCTSHEIKEIIDNQILPPPPPSPVLSSSSS